MVSAMDREKHARIVSDAYDAIDRVDRLTETFADRREPMEQWTVPVQQPEPRSSADRMREAEQGKAWAAYIDARIDEIVPKWLEPFAIGLAKETAKDEQALEKRIKEEIAKAKEEIEKSIVEKVIALLGPMASRGDELKSLFAEFRRDMIAVLRAECATQVDSQATALASARLGRPQA